MLNEFKNKIVLITGGTKGIGKTIAELYSKNGATVIVCSRSKHDFDLEGCYFYKLNVSNFDDCHKTINDIFEKFKRIDILINNAGIMNDKLLEKMSFDDFNSIISTNIIGCFNMTRCIINSMLLNKYGRIINFSSVVAKNGSFGQSNYVASKCAIEGLTKCWAKEFCRHGENITVNCVAPGPVLTDIFSNTSNSYLNILKDKIPLKRFGTTKEIAQVVLFLTSEEASFINGSIINVDGGMI